MKSQTPITRGRYRFSFACLEEQINGKLNSPGVKEQVLLFPHYSAPTLYCWFVLGVIFSF